MNLTTMRPTIACGLLVALALALAQSPRVLAQDSNQLSKPSDAGGPMAGERLSDWLLRSPLAPNELAMGLRWRVPAETEAQQALRDRILDGLARIGQTANTEQLGALINALPLTGRVPLPSTSARWLQANSALDPVIEDGEFIERHERSTRVVLLRSDGSVCAMGHRDGAVVQDYLLACDHSLMGQIDHAWLVQADGRVQLQKIGNWNASPLSELSPGAIIWAPARDAGFSHAMSEQLTAFLATQSVDGLISASGGAVLPQVAKRPSFTVQRDLPVTANDWGVIGLLQTPTARMAREGEFRFSYSLVGPYRRYNVFVQPFDGLSVGFRYTDITNRLYGASSTNLARTYTDKSIDLKLRLLEEDDMRPQLAVGITDLGGTGLFSGEYVVANKRTGDFDWSLGIGWGYPGASNNLGNPLGKIYPAFNTRSTFFGFGGKPSFGSFFRGPAALFGGVQYHLPANNWILKAEYEGNNYQGEGVRQSSPINFGVVYRQTPSLDWTLGIERGRALMLSLSLHAPMSRINTPKLADPARPAVVYERPQRSRDWLSTAIDLTSVSGWGLKEIKVQDDVLKVELDSLSGAHWDERIDRMVAVLHRDAPAEINVFDLVFLSHGLPLSRRYVDRGKWVLANTRLLPPSRQTATVTALPPELDSGDRTPLWERTPSTFGYALTPNWQQSIGGPDAFVLFRAGLAVPVQWRLAEDWNVTGALNLNLIDNYDNFTYTAPSNLPRVRTYAREYMTESRINLPNLQLTHFGQASANNFYSLYGGYLESSFAGVGAEWLYRPWHSQVAVGVDVNHVKQRSFNQFFGFGSAGTQTGYKVSTGHATVYWDTGWKDVQAKIAAGQYLARDRGVTLELSRTFNNGISVGAWATKTNISSAQFGEGSFDKGMYLKIPFDVLMTSRTGDWANLVYQPLTRDGGARLNRSFQLYGATTARGKRDTSYRPYNR